MPAAASNTEQVSALDRSWTLKLTWKHDHDIKNRNKIFVDGHEATLIR